VLIGHVRNIHMPTPSLAASPSPPGWSWGGRAVSRAPPSWPARRRGASS